MKTDGIRLVRETIDNHSRGVMPVLIFDGDDTLWYTMPLYRAAKDRFYREMTKKGFRRTCVAEFFEDRDVKNVARLGFSTKRFATSMLETYIFLCHSVKKKPNRVFARNINEIVSKVARGSPMLIKSATRVLATLQRGYRLFLLTKGERSIQKRRLSSSGLGHFFEHVIIVPQKTPTVLKAIMKRYKCPKKRTWVIGNSIKSDIDPALKAGLKAIWIPYKTWGYEEQEEPHHENLVKASSLRDVPLILNAAER